MQTGVQRYTAKYEISLNCVTFTPSLSNLSLVSLRQKIQTDFIISFLTKKSRFVLKPSSGLCLNFCCIIRLVNSNSDLRGEIFYL